MMFCRILVILADRRVYNVVVCMCLFVQQVRFIVNMYVCMYFMYVQYVCKYVCMYVCVVGRYCSDCVVFADRSI